jgi:hypothetical protein
MCQRIFGLAVVVTVAIAPTVAAQLPSTDIWLSDLRVVGSELRIGRPEKVTLRSGYENQPAFLPKGEGFLYTRGDSTGTDVYRYDQRTKSSIRITATPESEYSPTPFSGGGFCAVRVESDSTQRLWHFESDGSNPHVVMAAVDSVGYFAWLDASTVALFVVGDPHTLRVVDVETERETVIAQDIGRGLLRVPNRSELSFLARVPASDPPTYTFYTWLEIGRPADRLIDAIGTSQDAVWVGKTLVMSDGSKLHATRPFDDPTWHEIADLGGYGISGITRLAVSRDQRWLAFVAAESQ